MDCLSELYLQIEDVKARKRSEKIYFKFLITSLFIFPASCFEEASQILKIHRPKTSMKDFFQAGFGFSSIENPRNRLETLRFFLC